MPRFARPFALLLALCAFASVAHAKDDGHDKDRAAITKAYAAADKAWENKNVDALLSFYRDNTPKKHAAMRLIFADMQKVAAHTVIYHIQFSKDGAAVTNESNTTWVTVKNGAAHSYAMRLKSCDTLCKFGVAWQETYSVSISSHFTLDGRPMTGDGRSIP